MNTTANFEILVSLLEASSPSEKASIFLAKVANQIRARGDAWIAANAVALKVNTDHTDDFCPVSDNRAYFIGALQIALLK